MGYGVPQGSIVGQIWFGLLSLIRRSEKTAKATFSFESIQLKKSVWNVLHVEQYHLLATTIRGQGYWFSVRITLWAL